MSTEIVVYDNVTNPMEFVEKMGRSMALSGMFGCRNEQQGMVLALACLAEKKNPIELARTYHIIDGKLSMRADAMLAEFRVRGGKCRWLNTGDDHKEAAAEFEFDGQKMIVAFTIADAQRMKLVRKDSQWEKDPGAMLRARVTSKAIRMIAPEIIAGCYAPEEITRPDGSQAIDAEFTWPDGNGAATSPGNGQPAPEKVSAKEMMRRRAAAVEAGTAAGEHDKALHATDPNQEKVDDQSPPFATATAADQQPAPATAANHLADLLRRIDLYGPQAYGDKWPDAKAAALAKRSAGSLRSLSVEQADELLEKLMAKAMGLEEAKKKAAAATAA